MLPGFRAEMSSWTWTRNASCDDRESPSERGILLVLLAFGRNAICECVQFLAGLEANRFTGSDAHFSAGTGIAADSGFASPNTENAEAAQLNALSGGQSLFETLKNCVDCRFGLRAWQACALDHMMYDVLFNQSGHLASETVFDCTTRYRVDGTGFASIVKQTNSPYFRGWMRKKGYAIPVAVLRTVFWPLPDCHEGQRFVRCAFERSYSGNRRNLLESKPARGLFLCLAAFTCPLKPPAGSKITFRSRKPPNPT
jgi:hypothetical protein